MKDTSRRIPHESFSRIAGRRLALDVQDKGSDTTVFFIHGLGGNRHQWRLQWAYFVSRNVNLVAWDGLGHGQSARHRRDDAYASTFSVRDISAIIEKYPSKHRIVVAHSFGCRLTLEWLAGVGEAGGTSMVDAVILLGPAPLVPSLKGPLFNSWLDKLPRSLLYPFRPLLHRRFEALAWHSSADPALLREERAGALRNSLRVINATRTHAAPVATHALGVLGVGVNIIAGADDGLVPLAEIVKIKNAIPSCTLDILPECGHQIMLERPDEVIRAIERAIEKARGSGTSGLQQSHSPVAEVS